MHENRQRNRYWVGVLLLLLMVLGTSLRVYRLDAIPVWYDDYITYGYLGAPQFSTYLTLVHFAQPDHAPSYFLLQYFWSHAVGTSPVSIRLLSVLMSVTTIPLIYVLARYMYTVRSGLIAALCVTLSPLHIWYGQAMRYNSLVEVLALVSIYALVRALREGKRRWWIINLVANALLLWSHVLTLVLLFTEGCFLVLALSYPFRRKVVSCAAWALVHLVFLTPTLLWLRDSAPYTVSSGVSSGEDFYVISKYNVLVDLLGDDAITLAQPWMFFSSTSKWIPRNPYEAFIRGTECDGWVNRAFMLFFGGCVVWALVRLARAAPVGRRGTREIDRRAGAQGEVLLLLLVFLPVCVLALASYLIRPCLQPHYTLYSSFALYTIVGGALAQLPTRAARWGGLSVLLAFYGYQLGLMLPETTRTDWLSAARHITANASEHDLIMIRGRFFATETFRCSMGQTDIPIISAYTLQAICEKSAQFLKGPDAMEECTRPNRKVWVVIEVAFDYPPLPLESFEESLAAYGLAYSRRLFPGIGGMAVYGIETDRTAALSAEAVYPSIPVDIDYVNLLRDLGVVQGKEEAYNSPFLPRLRRVIEVAAPRGAFTYTQFAISLADESCLELAEAAARKAIEIRPDSPLGYFALAVALGESDAEHQAVETFHKALELDRIGFVELYATLFMSLYQVRDSATARAEIKRLDRMGAFVPQTFRACSGALPLARELRSCR